MNAEQQKIVGLLRSMAQNNEMIDNHYTEQGQAMMDAADLLTAQDTGDKDIPLNTPEENKGIAVEMGAIEFALKWVKQETMVLEWHKFHTGCDIDWMARKCFANYLASKRKSINEVYQDAGVDISPQDTVERCSTPGCLRPVMHRRCKSCFQQ